VFEYLESALPLARKYGLGMVVAKLDLSNRPARHVDLPKNYRRAGPCSNHTGLKPPTMAY
jgi:hypothetical protein